MAHPSTSFVPERRPQATASCRRPSGLPSFGQSMQKIHGRLHVFNAGPIHYGRIQNHRGRPKKPLFNNVFVTEAMNTMALMSTSFLTIRNSITFVLCKISGRKLNRLSKSIRLCVTRLSNSAGVSSKCNFPSTFSLGDKMEIAQPHVPMMQQNGKTLHPNILHHNCR